MERKKNFVVYTLSVMAAVVFCLTSCETENFGGTRSETENLEFYLNRNGEPNGNRYEWTITMGERTNKIEFKANGHAALTEEKYDYRILENQKDLDVSYTNTNRVIGETEAVVENNITHYKTKCSFPWSDGNTSFIEIDIEEKSVVINGKSYNLPTDMFKDAKILSLSNTPANATRSGADYNSEILNTQVTAELTFETKGLPVNYEYTKILTDVVVRRVMSPNDIADHRWDEASKKKEWPNDSLEVVSANHYNYWKDGAVDTMRATYTYSRILKAQTNWSSEAKSSAQTTGAITAKLINSQKVSTKTNGGLVTVTAYREQRSLSNVVSLNGADDQTNKATSVEYNNISFEYMGDVISFGEDNLSISDATAVTAGAGEEDFDIFNYTDEVSYKFGDSNTKKVTLPGKIKVAVERFFPPEWGEIISAVETVSRDETKKDYKYVWSIHFKEGTLPVPVPKDGMPEWNFSYFEYNTDARLNSGNYIKSQNKWINSIASDEADFMLYTSSENKSIDNMPYSTGIAWNWDGCADREVSPSVFTEKHKVRAENGRLYSTLGSWR